MSDKDIDNVHALLEKARQAALKLIVKRARKVMREHPECKEFVMGMGSATFTTDYRWHDPDYPNDPTQYIDRREYWPVNDVWNDTLVPRPDWLDDIVEVFNKFDYTFKLSGTPMRFTAYGELQADW